MGKTTEELVKGFYELSTPVVSDALDKLGIRCGCYGIVPIVLGKKIVGPAFTVKYIPVGRVKGSAGDYIDEVKEGEVVVLDNGGRMYGTVWGDILTYVAVEKKIAGTVIDGVCRDVDGIREMDYPMFTRGHTMVTGKDRVMLQSKNEMVAISDIQVKQGDLIMGDGTGVLVIPRDVADEVLESSQAIDKAEQAIISEVKKGSSLYDARQKFHYHELQRKE